MYRLQPKDPGGSSAARVIVLAILLELVALSCGGYGVQIWQRSGPGVAAVTLLGATTLMLAGVAMIVYGARALRASRPKGR